MSSFKRIISDFYNYNKTLVYIVISVILIIILGSVLLLSNNNNQGEVIVDQNDTIEIKALHLFGSSEITLEQGEKYVEPGFYAISTSGEVKTNDVIVTPEYLDTSTPGTYYINYVIGNKMEQRQVTVIKKEVNGVLKLELNGDSMIVLNVSDEYIEPGFIATDTIDGDLTDKVIINGSVDTSKKGTYTITYEVENSNGDKVKKTRTVIVNDQKLDVEIETNLSNSYTNSNITATISITGDSFSYIKYPNNTVSKNKVSNYTILENGYYEFYIYDNNSNYIVKELNVTEIDKVAPTGTCNLAINNGKSTIQINADDNLSGIKNYQIYANNNLVSDSKNATFIANASYSSAYVNVYDNAGNFSKINCTLSGTVVDSKYDYLEMHFIVSGHNDDAILIRTGGGTILIDSGRKGCEKEVLPYLNDLGIKSIDAMIGSHPHFNHIQAQAFVIEKYPVKKSYYSVDLNTCVSKSYCRSNDVKYILDAIKKYNIPMVIMNPGDVITVGDMTLYILGPYKLNNTCGSDCVQNLNSSIFILKYKNNSFMFTGDTGSTPFTLEKLKPYADKFGISLKVDMLKYPHHGNANLDEKLVNVMKPEYVIVPNYKYASKFNSSGKSKLKKVGSKIYQQASDYNIVLISDGNNITVKTKQSAATYKR